jgi:hypothetical protein
MLGLRYPVDYQAASPFQAVLGSRLAYLICGRNNLKATYQASNMFGGRSAGYPERLEEYG